MTGTTPPPLQGPTSKERKYDRQLRLWAASGQAALEDAHILLINSGPGVVGVETLKNLVLPGVGRFTILDSALVTQADLGVNFFLEEGHLGQYRAEHTCNLLKELNPDVQGFYITEPLETFFSKPDPLKPYSLILVTSPIKSEILANISAYASETATPVFYIHSVGFYSHFSVHLPPSYPIVDTHPDPATTTDLRLLSPWPALLQFAEEKTKNIDSLDDHEHGHIPYVLILLHYLEEWKASHEGQVPQNYKEKTAFRDFVRAAARTSNPEGGEENFDEAVAAVLKSLNPPQVSSTVKEVLAAPECTELTADSPNFWIIAHAISDFYNKHGVLPLPGSVPDMKAQSADYIRLQNIYKAKAREDLSEVSQSVRELERKLDRSTPIEEKEIEAFCKNAGHIQLVRGRPFHVVRPGEKVRWGERAKFAVSSLSNLDALLPLYIAFLAYDEYCVTHLRDGLGGAGRPPGVDDADTDAEKLTGIAYKFLDDLIAEAGTRVEEPEYTEVKDKLAEVAKEITRAAGGELHNIAALTGGLVSQEVIKVVTKQYLPVDNTCLFDGITSKTSVVRL